jgi:hypothetical protein
MPQQSPTIQDGLGTGAAGCDPPCLVCCLIRTEDRRHSSRQRYPPRSEPLSRTSPRIRHYVANATAHDNSTPGRLTKTAHDNPAIRVNNTSTHDNPTADSHATTAGENSQPPIRFIRSPQCQ